jgi:hypothetical protein
MGKEMKLNIKVDFPPKLRRFLNNPSPIFKEVMRDADKVALKLMQAEIKQNAPKKSGALAESIRIDVPKRKVFSTLAYSRAVQLGHYATPVRTPKRRFLMFESGGNEVFLKFTRSRKQPFFFDAVSYESRRKIIEVYDKAFKKLLGKL